MQQTPFLYLVFVQSLPCLVFVVVVVVLAERVKKWRDILFLATPQPEIADLTKSLGLSQRRAASTEAKSTNDPLKLQHSMAKNAQNAYIRVLARCVISSLLGFMILCVNVVGMAAATFRPQLASIDGLAIILALYWFFVARHFNRSWLQTRAAAEFTRHVRFLRLLFTENAIQPNDRSRDNELASAALRIANAKSSSALISDVNVLWKETHEHVVSGQLAFRSDTGNALQVYLQRRPVRQLAWFIRMQQVLATGDRRRKNALRLLFIAALLLTILHVLLVFFGNHEFVEQIVALLMMSTIGLSSAIASYHLSRGTRSLLHRFREQEEQIRVWITRWGHLFDRTEPPASDEIMRDVIPGFIAFEELMRIELVDWITVTATDVIELTP